MSRSFAVNVGEALHHPGMQIPLALTGSLAGVALSSVRIVEDAEVRFDGTVEAQGTIVTVQGVASAPWVGECRRCLGPTRGEVRVELREVFEESPIEDETHPLADDRIDLGPVVQEAVALALPLAPLCREDCAGPDPDAHPVGVPEGAERSEPVRDPRWAALDELRFDA